MAPFERFIQTGLFLRGWSAKTPLIYRRAFASFQSLTGETTPSKSSLERWIIAMRKHGHTPAGVNIYIRAMNAFCSWAREEDLLPALLKLKQLKHNPKPVTPLSSVEIKVLMAHKPKRKTYQRTWIMIALMLDTGCRIDEVLGLKIESVDFDNLLLTVKGKGDKPRRIPFSAEMRKHLYRYVQRLTGQHLFGTANNTPVTYRNAHRNIRACFRAAGITGPHIHPHNLRHTFACSYIRNGGNVFTLSRILGHSSVTTTQTYLRGLQVEDLQHLSPLSGG